MVTTAAAAKLASLMAEMPQWQQDCARAYIGAQRPLIMTDYDGTLCELVRDPHLAGPTPQLIALLKAVSSTSDTAVCSGRDAETLERWLGKLPLTLIAEHGARVRGAVPGTAFVDKVAPGALAWMPAAQAIIASETAKTHGSMLETKRTSLAWHYRNADADLGPAAAHELTRKLEAAMPANVEVHPGKMVVEVRPRGIDKGGAVAALAPGHDFVLLLGDDRTDEDMFAFVRDNVWSVKVGDGETRARHRIGTAAEVRGFLARLAEARS